MNAEQFTAELASMTPPVYEYKVYGHRTERVEGKDRKLSDVFGVDAAAEPVIAEELLNKLGDEGWEPVVLTFPFVFRRVKA